MVLHLISFSRILEKRKSKKVARQTIQTYDYTLNHRILPSFGHKKIEDITDVFINNFCENLKEDNLSSATIQKHFMYIPPITKYSAFK